MRPENPTNEHYKQKLIAFRETLPEHPMKSYKARIGEHYMELLKNISLVYGDLQEAEFVESLIETAKELLFEIKLSVSPFSPEPEELHGWLQLIGDEHLEKADARLVEAQENLHRYNLNKKEQQSRRIYQQYLEFLEKRLGKLTRKALLNQKNDDGSPKVQRRGEEETAFDLADEYRTKEEGLSYAEAALVFAYEGVEILTKSEAIKEAKRYTFQSGFRSATAPKQLITEYKLVFDTEGRLNPLRIPNNKRKVKALERKIEKILPLLTDSAKSLAEGELERVKKYFKRGIF